MGLKNSSYIKTLLSAFASGVFIGIAGIANLVAIYIADGSNLDIIGRIAGAFLFTTAIVLILALQTRLYTGKIGFAFEHKPIFILDLLTILLGNAIGAIATGYLVSITNLGSKLSATAVEIANSRFVITNANVGQSWYSVLILAIFCGILVFLAVFVYKTVKNESLKILLVIMLIMIFALAGFEHCIANMFYFSIARSWNINSLLNVLLAIVGNSIGSITFYFLFKSFGLIKENVDNI